MIEPDFIFPGRQSALRNLCLFPPGRRSGTKLCKSFHAGANLWTAPTFNFVCSKGFTKFSGGLW